MPRWYDKAIEEAEKDEAEGVISYEEFRAIQRDLDDELRSNAEEDSAATYDNAMGGW